MPVYLTLRCTFSQIVTTSARSARRTAAQGYLVRLGAQTESRRSDAAGAASVARE